MTLLNIPVAIFVLILLVVSIRCILVVHDNIKRNTAASGERDETLPARPRTPLMTPQRALMQARAEARKQEAQRRAEVWKNMTPSLVNEAFSNFYKGETEASFDPSLLNAAFEKFTKEMGGRQ